MKVRIQPRIAIPAGIAIVFCALGFLGATKAFEYRVFDLFLHVRKSPVELKKSITLVAFDDQSIEKAGTWPIGRDVMADSLMLLSECGSRYAVFDIEYVNKSPGGVNRDILSTDIPESFNTQFGTIDEQMKSFVSALQQGNIPLKEANAYVGDFQGMIQSTKNTLQSQVAKIARDNDEYLGQAVRANGNAFLTIHMLMPNNRISIPPETKKLAVDRFALKALTDQGLQPRPWVDIQPPILPIESEAKGLGFTNVSLDPDGVRRRIDLVVRYGNSYFPQLVMAPLLNWLGNPAVVVGPRKIILKDAHFPDGAVRTISIPLDPDGRMIINWPHKKFLDSFTQLSFAELLQHKEDFDTLVYNLKLRESWGYLDLYKGDTPLLEMNRQAETLRDMMLSGEESPSRMSDYRALRDRFITEVGSFLDSKPEEQIASMVATVLADRKTKAKDREQYTRIGADAPTYFAELRRSYKSLVDIRKDIVSKVDGSLCVLGQTSTGSTDIGINPFDTQYPNIGTHASLANTILTRDFLTETPIWVSALAALLLTGVLVFASRNTKPLVTILFGVFASLAVLGLDMAIFAFSGIYVPVLPPLLSIFFSFLALTFIQFLDTEREKGFIRNAFSHYLSEAVIKDIVGNPDKLKLGGELRHMTAMFTDIKGFSSISEKLSPVSLVKLLNEYLTAMSDMILDLGGTIDKYEGDAIISFFGAPLDLPSHALRACQAAVRMKKIESEINVRFIQEELSPSDLLTRMGINTGEMVVGNMGTVKKMNYTIMGDSVNLASRLEGVNKQYGTWLCVSEDTMNEAKDGIIVRRLDRIRVVGKSQPIRIYELVDEKGLLDQRKADVIGLFEQALSKFESRLWDEADVAFRNVLAVDPEDGPSKTYLERIAKYKQTPPPDNWDGVFVLTTK
jgi:adenylate cyclase